MKTVNFLTSHFIPENTACTNRVLAFVNELKKNYKINVICLTEKGKPQKESHRTLGENVEIYYVDQKEFSGKNFPLRIVYEIYHLSKLVKISNSLACDVVIATTPYMFMIPLVGFGVNNKKILDIRDLVWEYIEEKNLFRKAVKKTFRTVMKAGIKRFDHVVVTNEYESQLLENRYITNQVDIIPNGIDEERYEKLCTLQKKTDTPFTVTYIGNIGYAHNLKLLVSAAQELPDVNVVIIGDGMELEDIKNYASENAINNVRFTGKLQWDELKPYYESSSVLYSQLQKRLISAMPSKLYEYASTGLPILYGGTGHAVSFVQKLEHAVVIQPDSLPELVGAIKKMEHHDFAISEKNRAMIKESYLRNKTAIRMAGIVGKFTESKEEEK
jgi:glycosyltransferase involved in cell wall biosynthesis